MRMISVLLAIDERGHVGAAEERCQYTNEINHVWYEYYTDVQRALIAYRNVSLGFGRSNRRSGKLRDCFLG